MRSNFVKNKRGAVSPIIVVLLTLMTAALIFGVYELASGNLQTAFNPGQTGQTGGNNNGGTTIITTNPTISFVAQQAQNVGTTVASTYQVAFNRGAFGGSVVSGSGTAVPGQTADFLVNASAAVYHPAQVLDVPITASTFPLTVQLNKNASVTEVLYYPYSGKNIAGTSATAGNVTNINSNGASYIFNDNMYGTTQASTQDMLCIVELTDGVNFTSTGAILSGAGVTADAKYGNSIPPFYTVAGVNSRVWSFDVPAIASAANTPLTLTLQLLSTKSAQDRDKVIKTCYSKEYYIDSATGKITYGVADSQTNTVQSIAQYTFTGYFGSS
jgi:hypothetical protein